MKSDFVQMIILAQSSCDKAVRLVESGKVELKDLEKTTSRLMDLQIKLAKQKI